MGRSVVRKGAMCGKIWGNKIVAEPNKKAQALRCLRIGGNRRFLLSLALFVWGLSYVRAFAK